MDFDVARNLRGVLADLPEGVKLVAVSKYHPTEYIEAAYAAGCLAKATSKSFLRNRRYCRKISSGISLAICKPIR